MLNHQTLQSVRHQRNNHTEGFTSVDCVNGEKGTDVLDAASILDFDYRVTLYLVMLVTLFFMAAVFLILFMAALVLTVLG
jgi:hypothetical protein